MAPLDEVDKKILMALQKGLDLVPRPYAVVAAQSGAASEAEVLERIRRMEASGLIRRMAGFFNSQKLGYVTTLCAAQVSAGAVADVAEALQHMAGVTHNYERNHPYNMWFTLISPSLAVQESALDELSCLPGVEELLHFTIRRMFKLRVVFDV